MCTSYANEGTVELFLTTQVVFPYHFILDRKTLLLPLRCNSHRKIPCRRGKCLFSPLLPHTRNRKNQITQGFFFNRMEWVPLPSWRNTPKDGVIFKRYLEKLLRSLFLDKKGLMCLFSIRTKLQDNLKLQNHFLCSDITNDLGEGYTRP